MSPYRLYVPSPVFTSSCALTASWRGKTSVLKRAVGLLHLLALAGRCWAGHCMCGIRASRLTFSWITRQMATARNASAAEAVLRAAEKRHVSAQAIRTDSIVRLQRIQLIHLTGNPASGHRRMLLSANSRKRIKLHVRCIHYLCKRQARAGPADGHRGRGNAAPCQGAFRAPAAACRQIVSEPEFVERVAVTKPPRLDAEQTRPSPDAAAPYFWTPPPSAHV